MFRAWKSGVIQSPSSYSIHTRMHGSYSHGAYAILHRCIRPLGPGVVSLWFIWEGPGSQDLSLPVSKFTKGMAFWNQKVLNTGCEGP